MSTTSPVTIPEIARLAGVGTATVDRVLNGRPGVNVETTKRVMQAVSELGMPTVARGRPKKNKNFRFAYVLPKGIGKFFETVERRIAQQAGEFRHQGITEITYTFNAEDPETFADAIAAIDDCDGLAIVAPDLPAIKQAINDQVRAGVHVVTMLSDVAGSMRESYIGPDNKAAGRTAGLLLARMATGLPQKKLIALGNVTRLSSEIERNIGFSQIIEENFPHLKVVRSPEMPLTNDEMHEKLKSYLTFEMPLEQLVGIYCTGQVATQGVVSCLKEIDPDRRVGLIVHDLTEYHQLALGRGDITYVLDQDNQYCISAAAKVLRGLCENVRGAVQVVKPRVDILTAENYH